jgi:hypothetical protein
MLLLVMVAAFIFLFQEQNTLETERDVLATRVVVLEGDVAQNGIALQSAESTRTAQGDMLATVESDAVLLEGQLVESQQQLDNATRELANMAAAMESTAVAPPPIQPPSAAIVSPTAADTVLVNQTISITLVAADPQGLTAVNLTINNQPHADYDPNNATLYTASANWTPTEPGDYELAVLAINSNGVANTPAISTITVTEPETETETALGQTAVLVDPNAAIRAQIEQDVSELRALKPITPVVTTLLTRAQLGQRITTDLFAEYTPEEAARDVIALSAFDFLPSDFDLYSYSQELYTEQIAGFYDPETDEFVVISEDDTLSANEQLTHAHEFVHALQDQHFNLDVLDDESLTADAAAAFTAMIEGEATLIQSLYLFAGDIDVGALFAEMETLQTPVLDSAPPILVNSLTFPYLSGMTFVQTLYNQDGLAALNNAWANPPQSTEHILHPERYLANDTPQLVTLPPFTATLGSGWQLADEDVLGEFMLREYVGQQLTRTQVDTAVTGWGGDRYAVYYNEANDQQVMVLRIVWDTAEDATEFAALYPNYPVALFNTAGALSGNGRECWTTPTELICLTQNERETLIVRAPNPALEQAIRQAILN